MADGDANSFEILLPADSDAAGIARRFVAEHAASLQTDLVADAELLVSELVTNAVRYGRAQITMRMNLEPPLIGVTVHDEGEALPPSSITPQQADDASGRGLLIVASLSSTWGVNVDDGASGKTVWFHIRPDETPSAS